MTYAHAIILGIIEGITEFLPVSSTGHLLIAERLLGVPTDGFGTSFVIAIQAGAMLAVIAHGIRVVVANPKIIRHIIIAFIPTAIIGASVYRWFLKDMLENPLYAVFGIFIGGVALIVFERKKQPVSVSFSDMTWRESLQIGFAQSVALFPGISRSAASILGGMYAKLSRTDSVQFSFLLGIPTIFAATGFDLITKPISFSNDEWKLLAVGIAVSAVSAYASIRWLLKFVATNTFVGFGIYRIAFGGIVLAYILAQ